MQELKNNVMASLFDTRSMQLKIEEKAPDLFKEKPESPLEVTRFLEAVNGQGDRKTKDKCLRKEVVRHTSHVKRLRNDLLDDFSQTFIVRQARSWTTLDMSKAMMEQFMSSYEVMPSFWKHIFTFGRKSEENEFQFPGFTRCRTRYQNLDGISSEFAYIARRVEHTELSEQQQQDGNTPWKIRQTAVYHKCLMYQSGRNSASTIMTIKPLFMLVAPSVNVDLQLQECPEDATPGKTALVSVLNKHRMIVEDGLRGWMDYMAYLNQKLKNRSDRIVLAEVGLSKANVTTLADFDISFEDRQELKILEDNILDLQVILPGIVDTITGLIQHFGELRSQVLSQMDVSEIWDTEAIFYRFDEYLREAKQQVERAKVLKEEALGTSRLLSDLLNYEEAVALKDLALETQVESKSMCSLTERSVKDAAAVKILTVITLVYLPTTIVANFFSTEFVQINKEGHMQVYTSVWLLAAISIPLTLLTVVLWYGWVHFTRVEPVMSPGQPGVMTLQRAHSFRSFVSSRKKQRRADADLESGIGSRLSGTFQPATPGTWSSEASHATTVKVG